MLMITNKKINKERDVAIDTIKFIATFMVLNSHMSVCYISKYQYFATGGGIGNALFFFVSGFTLYLGKFVDFPNYYKRRIARIYPSVIGMALVACIVWESMGNMVNQLTGYWFVNCIMVYYILLWIARRIDFNLKALVIVSLIITLLIFFFGYDFKSNGLIYGSKQFRYFIYFVFMTQGAYMGIHRLEYRYKWWHVLFLFFSILSWYAINYFFSHSYIQLVSIPILMCLIYFLYLTAKSPLFVKLLKNKIIKNAICFCGGLCLEVYMIQKYIFTDSLNDIFPFNIPIIMIMCLVAAYILKIIGNVIGQTLNSAPYEWRRLFV